MNALLIGDINVKIDTDIRETEFKFKWIIQRVSRIPSSTQSMRFSLVGDVDKDWFVTVITLPQRKFRVALTCDSEKHVPLRIEHTTRVLDTQSRPLRETTSGLVIFQNRGEEKVLLDEVEYPDDDVKVVLECSMKIYGYNLNTICEIFDFYDAPDMDLLEYREGFRTMMNDETHADLKIHTLGRGFHAHKCVLKFRAPKFFDIHKVAIANGSVVLNTVPAHIFQSFLEYIYTGEEGQLVMTEDYHKLYSLACRFGVAGLQMRCARVLSRDFSVDSVVEIFLLAEAFNDEYLQLHCRVFMRKNLEELSTRPMWKYLLDRSPCVLEDVMRVHD